MPTIDTQFEDLVRTHHRAVSAYARALTSDRHVAEEAVQETFLRAMRWPSADPRPRAGSA